MPDEPDNPRVREEQIIQRLVRDTGVTAEQARELVSVFGHDWPSLVREARLMRKR
jgi:hypothetical protein